MQEVRCQKQALPGLPWASPRMTSRTGGRSRRTRGASDALPDRRPDEAARAAESRRRKARSCGTSTKSWYDVVGVVTGDSAIAKATIPRDGFGVAVCRIAPNRWLARVKFPRAGRWRLIIPIGAKEGFMIPPPVVRVVTVH